MAEIDFTVAHRFTAPAQVLWEQMIDWPSHADWIPATRMEVDPEDPGSDQAGTAQTVGATFTGYTGYGPLTLVDRMRVSRIEWDDAAGQGTCEVEKLGPVLRGRAGFTVTTDGPGSRLEWFEQVTVPYLPQLVAPIVNKLSALGFSLGMRRLARVITKKGSDLST